MGWVKKADGGSNADIKDNKYVGRAPEGYVVVAYADEIEQKFIGGEELADTADKVSRSDYEDWDVVNDMEPNIAVVKESDMAAIEEMYEKIKELINKSDVQPAD